MARIELEPMYSLLGFRGKRNDVVSNESIDVSHLMNGLYFFTYSDGITSLTEKFIKVE